MLGLVLGVTGAVRGEDQVEARLRQWVAEGKARARGTTALTPAAVEGEKPLRGADLVRAQTRLGRCREAQEVAVRLGLRDAATMQALGTCDEDVPREARP